MSQDILKKFFFPWLKVASGLALFLIISGDVQAKSEIYIDVGKPQLRKSLLALPTFKFVGSQSRSKSVKLGKTLFDVVSNDLNVSGLFTFIKPEAFLENPDRVGLKPSPESKNGFNYKSWKTIGTEFLVRGGYRLNQGKLFFEVFVYYVPGAKLVFSKEYEYPQNKIREIAHRFSNDLVEKLTGKRSFFESKIVVSSSRGAHGKGDRVGKEIWIMDWDGANGKKITNHRSIAQSPAWSPDGKKVAYMAFIDHKTKRGLVKNGDLFSYNLETKKRFLLSYRKGINSGAVFHPNGEHIYLTLSKGGSPDIYKMTVDGKSISRVTRGTRGAMYVEPAISPDGRKIAFSSTRGGMPMIYVRDINGGKPKRVTFAGRYNASPAWSPDGGRIAFAGYDKGHFDIFVMNANGTEMSRLTSAKKVNGKWANNEDPTFSPDGRHIMFVSDRTGKKQLYLVNLDGSDERRITFDRFEYFKPKWSPAID